jgi:hypothetical protein
VDNNNNISLKGTIIPITIATLLLPFGWFYYFFDIDSLLDATSDLIDNHIEANIDRSSPEAKDALSLAIGKDGEDGEDGEDAISYGDGLSTAVADGGNGGNGGNGGTSIGIPTQ